MISNVVTGRTITVSVSRAGKRRKMYLVTLEGSGTYLIKEELKYHGFKWDPTLKRWEKVFGKKEEVDDIVNYLKKFVEIENTEIEIFEKIRV